MAQQPEVPVLSRGAWMLFPVQRLLADLRNVRVENLETVDLEFQPVAVDRQLLGVPLADGPQVAAVSGRQSVQTAVDLVGMEPAFVLQVAVVENLRLHAD